MAFEMLDSDIMKDQLSNNADQFMNALNTLIVVIDADISKAIRKGVLDLFENINRRSPVDTGAYRASHCIANMIEPEDDEGIVKSNKGEKVPYVLYNMGKKNAWDWKVGDGDIWIFNNVPYAERIENGWSGQNQGGKANPKAPQGVYRIALAEFTNIFNKAVADSMIF